MSIQPIEKSSLTGSFKASSSPLEISGKTGVTFVRPYEYLEPKRSAGCIISKYIGIIKCNDSMVINSLQV